MSATKTAKRTVPFAEYDDNRCQFKTGKGRQCKLVIHPDEHKHMFVNRETEHKSLSEVVPAGFSLAATEVRKTDIIKKGGPGARDTKPRDADQKRVDGHASKSAGKNTAHNSKTPFENLTVTEYIVPPTAVDTVLRYIARATGSGGLEGARGMDVRYRKGTHPSGNVKLQWAIVKTAPKEAAQTS